jgi:hypothetical protein
MKNRISFKSMILILKRLPQYDFVSIVAEKGQQYRQNQGRLDHWSTGFTRGYYSFSPSGFFVSFGNSKLIIIKKFNNPKTFTISKPIISKPFASDQSLAPTSYGLAQRNLDL